jgi:hypothetical protein
LPEGLKSGDVMRVKSVIAANNPAYDCVLVPTDHSNYMVVDKTFKQHTNVHKKGDMGGSYHLSQAILGGQVGNATP